MKINLKLLAVAVLVSGAMLQGCSTTSSRPDSSGQSSQVVFPKAEAAWPKEGTFPELENLRMIRPGMTKDQLFALLGRPHFNEGFGHEWDYLFKFRTGNGDEVMTCQYKVLFDSKKLTGSVYWRPDACAKFLAATPSPQQVPVSQAAPVTVQDRTLQGDAVFGFNGWRLEDINPQGRAALADLAKQLRSMKTLSRVEVTAYTDRIGSDSENMALSQRRAETVGRFLVSQGVDPQVVVAQGRGAADPVVQCEDMPRDAMVKCLAPNRRVQVRAVGQAPA
ncbi:OmpA family protein [Cupriavidus numazuensis]|uniref:Outer membrane protein A n=1 Tax=Cupriavidus numazuensis TaxID=221992 RepID=A0ABM8TP75_9BURK|nr:OmpA family protein [Cupriavidus numazuensis]CAG2156837.1 Outer membrane protein A [Cupriavidus numazuensis]